MAGSMRDGRSLACCLPPPDRCAAARAPAKTTTATCGRRRVTALAGCSEAGAETHARTPLRAAVAEPADPVQLHPGAGAGREAVETGELAAVVGFGRYRLAPPAD